MSDNVKDIVDLAMDDKPNKAGEALDVVLRDRLANKVDNLKHELSNGMFGQEYQPDAEPVEDQQELDLEPIEDDSVEDDSNDYEAEQELVAEPEVDASEEQPDQEEDLGETEETDEIT